MQHNLSMKDFEDVKSLGTGSFGSVKLVRMLKDKQLYAIKTVCLSKLSQKEKDNALNEVRLLASINIPNVITYKGSFLNLESKQLCIVMEYADGGDLQGKILQKKQLAQDDQNPFGFEEQFIWKVAYELLHGLKILHKNNIIHRDIKSANIFFVNEIAKLGDMNVSKVVESGMCETQTGTPYYTSPEIWKGKKYGNKCDIWSTGIVLYEMCMLKPPFMARDFPSLYRKIIEGIYQDISPIYSDQLRDLIRMCLVSEEEMRPTAHQLLDTAILNGMEMSMTSFQQEEGQVHLIDPIKCPRVLRFLAHKLPKPRLANDIKKKTVNFTLTSGTKKSIEHQENHFKIKNVRKIRSEKLISSFEDEEVMKPINIISQKLQKNESKKNLKLPPLPNDKDKQKEKEQSFKFLSSPSKQQAKKSKAYFATRKLKNSSSSKKIIFLEEKENEK